MQGFPGPPSCQEGRLQFAVFTAEHAEHVEHAEHAEHAEHVEHAEHAEHEGPSANIPSFAENSGDFLLPLIN